jgi:hypothetical protein
VSDMAAACRTYLLTQAGVSSLVGSRVYFDVLPQTVTMPAVVIEMTADDIVRTLTATTTTRRTTLSVHSYADTHTGAVALGDAVETALEFKAGTWGSVTVKRSYVEATVDLVESPRDGSDAYRRIRSHLVVAWHT